ncbi:Putative amino-acid ABC transporter-binding protein YhdW [Seminavis robusta]|uniref:Amino-acid ABC transporter-binding protein YhdW n=1 Tax=Seminavis robusta TaxID=568900 RepID=A0A9N8ETH0_9STRA|nr:Putative amino-acid ABC transporter-binding protein YhdW [Seminavis robusta]|eukprot:Sro1903_g304520.1 Putative amino-acid ABC transporter-binding protein YhdW (790) ;mRNA; r:10749-13190
MGTSPKENETKNDEKKTHAGAGLKENPRAREEWESKRTSSISTKTGSSEPGAVSSTGNRSIVSKYGLRRRSDDSKEGRSTSATTTTSHDRSSAQTMMRISELADMPAERPSVVHVGGENEIVLPPHRADGTSGASSSIDLESARSHRPSNSEFLIEATLVPDDPVTPQQEPSPELAKVVEAEQLYFGFSKRQLLFLGGCLILIAVIVVIVTVTVGSSSGGEENADAAGAPFTTLSPTATPLPTVDRIRQRGELLCGIWDESHKLIMTSGVLEKDEDQTDLVLCRVLAAAVLGNASAYRLIETSQEDNFKLLGNGAVDVLTSQVETSMQSDVYETEQGKIGAGFTFSVPFVYIGIFWGGVPEFVLCAEDNYETKGNCSDLRICMSTDSEWAEIVVEKIPESFIVKRDNVTEILQGFKNGDCNVFPVESTGVTEFLLALFGHRGEYYRGTQPFVNDIGTLATRDDDPEWSDFVNIILMGLFAADLANVTHINAAELLAADVLGEELERAVEAAGNYAEIFDRGFKPIFQSREGWNLLNNGSTGLLFTLPLGTIQNEGPGPVAGGTLEEIRDRPNGKLHCGVRLGRPGFAVQDKAQNQPFSGLDVDMCSALAAGLSQGTTDAVLFVHVENEAQGYRMLQSGEVDVLAGHTWNIRNDYHEPGTGVGYSFTMPYFYKPVDVDVHSSNATFDENLCLVTRQDDPQFSSFVFWTVASTWHAEERGVTEANSRDMPDVNLFGFDYSKMFRDAIFAVGNYGEIYERNLASILPRGGRNMLNSVQDAGPQIYVPPGYFD